MGHPFQHALSSVKKFGGVPADYVDIHNWFDATKELYASWRHRALRHHSHGIYECERVFGVTITNSEGRRVPVRLIAEQHVREDLGWIPTVADWLRHLRPEEDWMTRGVDRSILEFELVEGPPNQPEAAT